MDIELIPGAPCGTINAVSSKSEAHRLLICAALADKGTKIHINGLADDVKNTIDCLVSMGADIEYGEKLLTVKPIKRFSPSPVLSCPESGSTLRFLLPLSCFHGPATFRCGERLALRPIDGLLNALEERGAMISRSKSEINVTGTLRSGEFRIPGNISSQYVSGLLFVLPLLNGNSDIVLTSGLESADYAEMTADMLSRFGIKTEKTDYGYFVPGGQKYISPGEAVIGGDWSNSAFFLAMGALGAEITVQGLDAGSPQGDKRILEFLRQYGADVKAEHGIRAVSSTLNAISADISGVPDLLPVLAVLSAFTGGESLFYGGTRLRFKESDRLRSCRKLINSLGGRAEETDDGLRVFGTGLHGGSVDSFNDHRIVMAAAAACCASGEKTVIRDAQAVNKSYPAFFGELEKLGVKCSVI